jgi:hypothetical protein
MSDSSRSKRIQIRLKPEEFEELQRLATRRDQTMSAVAREAVLVLIRPSQARQIAARRLVDDLVIRKSGRCQTTDAPVQSDHPVRTAAMTGQQRTFSLAAAAEEICGDTLKHPVEWLRRHIKTGDVRAYKVGRAWRMRREDIDAGLERFSNDVTDVSQLAEVRPIGVTPGSLRRRRAP